MKKVLNKKLVGQVFFKNSSKNKAEDGSNSSQMSADSPENLRKQINHLEMTVHNLKLELENKDIAIARLAREKEKLSINANKTAKSNDNLAQQLENERTFYFKEKRIYCEEMNEYKKLKKALSNSNIGSQIDNSKEYEKLKRTLENTLHTNYNLSVKFLRMRDTKNHLRYSLAKSEAKYKRVMSNLRKHIDNVSAEVKDVLNQKFDTPLSPSNKKYLQLVNHNSNLLYENLCLQMQLDRLHIKLKRNITLLTKSDTCNKATDGHQSKIKTNGSQKMTKIFERENKLRVSSLTIRNQNEVGLLERCFSERKLQLPLVNDARLEVFQVSELQSRESRVELMATKQRSHSAPNMLNLK